MHVRQDFKQSDPVCETQELEWLMQLKADDRAVVGTALRQLHNSYNALFKRRLRWQIKQWWIRKGDARDPEPDVVEAANNVWTDVLKKAGRFQADGAPARLYLRGFLLLEVIRYKSKHAGLPPEDNIDDPGVEAEIELGLHGIPPGSDRAEEFFDFARCVRRALSELEQRSPGTVAILLDHHVEELSLAEMAMLGGRSAGQLKGDLFEARNQFRPLVEHCLKLWPNREKFEP